MELCERCRRPILKPELVWREKLTARQSHSSPEQWDMVPVHEACADRERDPTVDPAYERAAARYDGTDKDWR